MRKPLLGALVGALTLLTAACSSGSPSPGSASGPPAGSLRVVDNWTGPEGAAFHAVIAGFEQKYPKVHVQVQQVPFEQTQSLLTQQFAQGNPPDVAVGLPGIIRNLAKQNLLINLDSVWNTWVKDGDYTPALRSIATAGTGHAYSVLFKGNVNGLIWYTPAQLSKLGINVPHTWATFTAAMDKAKNAGVAPLAVGGKDGWPLTQWADPIILGVAGPQKFNELERGQIGWNDPAIVKAFQTYADIARNYFPKNQLGTSFIDATCARADGKAVFQNQGAFISLIAPAECGKGLQPGKDFTFFPMPKPNPSTAPSQAISGDEFFGAQDTDNMPATMALLKYLGSAQAQTIWAKRGGYIAPNAKVPMSAYPTAVDRAAAKLWPTSSKIAAGYDLDDWIGGEIQAKYTEALQQLTRDYNVSAFIHTMTQVDTRSKQ